VVAVLRIYSQIGLTFKKISGRNKRVLRNCIERNKQEQKTDYFHVLKVKKKPLESGFS
jgi:hypothetical protein